MELFLFVFGENFIGSVKVPFTLFSMLKSIMKIQNRNQNVNVENMVVFVKTFDQYHYKFQLFQLSCKIVIEFETTQF